MGGHLYKPDFLTARTSPCTPVGLKLRYFSGAAAALALEVEVLLEATTATASAAFAEVLMKAGLLDMLGTYDTDVFRAKMCREEGRDLFPYACDFFAPQHLGSLCSPLSRLLAQSAH